MIVYWLTPEGERLFSESWMRHYDSERLALLKPELRMFRGKVVVTKHGDAIVKKRGNFARFTLFDDATPPNLLRHDYSLSLLDQLGADVPQVYAQRNHGKLEVVRRTVVTDKWGHQSERFEILMEGPE